MNFEIRPDLTPDMPIPIIKDILDAGHESSARALLTTLYDANRQTIASYVADKMASKLSNGCRISYGDRHGTLLMLHGKPTRSRSPEKAQANMHGFVQLDDEDAPITVPASELAAASVPFGFSKQINVKALCDSIRVLKKAKSHELATYLTIALTGMSHADAAAFLADDCRLIPEPGDRCSGNYGEAATVLFYYRDEQSGEITVIKPNRVYDSPYLMHGQPGLYHVVAPREKADKTSKTAKVAEVAEAA